MRSQDRDTLHDIERLGECVRRLRKELHNVDEEIKALESAGATKASKYVDGRGNLYLIHPQRDGERVREYIGKDKQVQAAAMARIERWNQLQQKRARKTQIESALAMIRHRVDDALQSAGRA